MAKFKFELSPAQLADVTKQAKAKLQSEFDAQLAKTKKQHEAELVKLEKEFNASLDKLNDKFKYGEVVVEDSAPKPTAARHSWTLEEFEELVTMYGAGARAKEIGAKLGIAASAVNAKITTMKKAAKK